MLQEHIASCSSIGKLADTTVGCVRPRIDHVQLPEITLYNSRENWEEEPKVPSYDPMEVSSKKPVIRCVSGLTKSEKRKYKESERARMAALRGFTVPTVTRIYPKDTTDEMPLRPPRNTAVLSTKISQGDFKMCAHIEDDDNDDDDDDDNDNEEEVEYEGPNAISHAKLVTDSFHRKLYDELAPEDDDITQLEESLRRAKLPLTNYFQCADKKDENFSKFNLSQQTNMEKLEPDTTSKPFNIDNRKDEGCVASTSSGSGERVTDKLLALLKEEPSVKKPTEEPLKIDQMIKNPDEKGPAWEQVLSKVNDRLTYLTDVQNAAAEESAQILKQLEELKLCGVAPSKARRYDTRTTIFSPEGRLYQVEYAMEAISHAGTCLGILANDGILLAAEKRNTNKLLDEVFFSEKIYKLNNDIVCSVAGITSDANVLTNELRLIAQRYLLQYGEAIPCEQLVSWLCDVKQAYTQYGGKRPFGVSILYMGWDKYYGYQLYQSDPSGNYGGWKATCIGNNSAAAVSSLKQEYKEGETTLKDAMALAIKVLTKTLDMNKLSAEKVEMAILTRENGKTKTKILPGSEVNALIAEHDRLEALAEQTKKEKQKS
ncbi:PREDICTED: uncharacterized protein LOC105563190 [Vollenhovia emeryi]|uniref:uncharacterized protein LOC105563190 n=1 Tax=Vollenhovia emeryi TaxID=411798 RepID=UPI0005F38B5C|nr:PREDICTED: uncharacterized protein LOC105563190 [Vollenhovia emeryi]